MVSWRALVMMIVQLKSESTSSADMVILPSGVAILIANSIALAARTGVT